jgi:hypothetical protein
MARSTPGRVVLAVFVVWFVLAAVRSPRDAQDAVPLVVAGELVTDDPGSVYVDGETGGLFDLRPAFAARSCEVLHPRLRCEDYAVAFVSPPGALPVAVGLAALGPDQGIRAVRLLAFAGVALGMAVLWGRLARAGPQAPAVLAGCTVLLTPLALNSIGLGQSTPLLFLSVVLGTGAAVRGRPAVVRGVVWAATVLSKASPLALGAVLVVQRRWWILGSGLAVVAAAHLGGVAIGGWGVVGGFLDASGAVADEAARNPYNGAFEAALVHLPGGGVDPDLARGIGWGLRLVAGALALVGFFRIADRDVQWAFAWAVLVALLPMAWWHYSIVSFGALAVAVERSEDPARRLWLLPALLVVGMPMSLANNVGSSVPTAQALLAVAVAAAVYRLGRPAVAGRVAVTAPR